MKLISKVAIKGFRSIRDDTVVDLGDFTAFAGLNNSGKSNVLRALNAFFSGETDPGLAVNVDDDFFRPDLRKKKAKRIRVTVTFSLPDHFRFRKGLQPVQEALGEKTFELAKEWTRGEQSSAYFLNNSRVDLETRQKIDQFLQLVNFRYIPNRVLPVDVIRSEHRALRDVLVHRLGQRAQGSQGTFDAIRDVSQKMIQELVNRFQQACPGAGDVRLATPTSWSEMVFAFGYRLGAGGVEIEDAAQGSGIQSLLMLETLYLIDRDYFQKFGWRQAAIWAVEEPESSLHSSLEAQVASYLRTISTDPASRLQVLCTTHSDLVVQYSDRVVIAAVTGGETKFTPHTNKREALELLSRAGVSHWVHPLLYFPLDPVILVSGEFDHAFFEEAFKCMRREARVHVTYLKLLDGPEKTGGDNELKSYIKANVQAIKNRQADAPVVVVLDWDAASKKQEFEKILASGDPYKVLVWPESAFNPKLGKTFRGIERSYPDRIIQEGEKAGLHLYRDLSGVCSVDQGEYKTSGKKTLCNIVRRGLKSEDLVHAQKFVEEIPSAAGVSI
jgi:energy-coupling factor transporter ATP-binding protein EcfA2